MQRKIYLSPHRRNFLMQQSLFNLFFFFVIILFVSSSKIVSRQTQKEYYVKRIHLREWNRNFDRSNFPPPIRLSHSKAKVSGLLLTNNHSNTWNCIGTVVARTKSNSPQSARSGQSFTTSTIFSGCCIRSVNNILSACA